MLKPNTSASLRSAALPKQFRKSSVRFQFYPHYQFKHAFSSSPRSPPNGLPVSTVFTFLAIFGVVVTGYGIYDFYSSFSVWPEALRSDLRAAIKAQNQGNHKLSVQYFRSAWETCLRIPKEQLGPDPWLKISGIACKLGEVLESANNLELAYGAYLDCANAMRELAGKNELSVPERQRTVALGLHIANLAGQLNKSHDEEQWLLWSVEQLMAIHAMSTKSPFSGSSSPSRQWHADYTHAEDLGLPTWSANGELEAALEALGSYYAKQGQLEYALSLYLRAISHILPPESAEAREKVSPLKRCRAAQLMTNISNLLIQDTPSPERLEQAKQWTTKGLELVEKSRQATKTEMECERALAVSFYNLGAILEIQNKNVEAKEQFKRALSQSRDINFTEGIDNAEDGLARLALKRQT